MYGVIRADYRLLALACIVALAGCRHDPGIVPVSGKVTLNGGDWPKPGYIDFSPVEPAEGFPAVPAAARFDVAGNFVVKTGPRDGLMPGRYLVTVRCWERMPTLTDPGKNYAPERFSRPNTSGLELKVEPGSKPIVQNWDIPTGDLGAERH